MKLSTAVEILEKHNRWRRCNEDSEMVNPTQLGIAIDTIIEYLKKKVWDDNSKRI